MSTEKRMSKPKPIEAWAVPDLCGELTIDSLYEDEWTAGEFCEDGQYPIPVLITPLENGEKK